METTDWRSKAPGLWRHCSTDRTADWADHVIKPIIHMWSILRKCNVKHHEWLYKLISIVNFEEMLWLIQIILNENATIFPETWGIDSSPRKERLMLTFMTEAESPAHTPPSFLVMALRISGIEIKGKSKKKYQVTTRENTLTMKSQMKFWVLVLSIHFQFGSESGIKYELTNQWIFAKRKCLIWSSSPQLFWH